ncbi:hypothetical protein [Deinococcus hohokamensis]|uniref:Uncharacterized protein n=1 Tax=Deinococcus hohokamensis TaxID=309883 RepID=A0ABV9I6C7_9DEIO
MPHEDPRTADRTIVAELDLPPSTYRAALMGSHRQTVPEFRDDADFDADVGLLAGLAADLPVGGVVKGSVDEWSATASTPERRRLADELAPGALKHLRLLAAPRPSCRPDPRCVRAALRGGFRRALVPLLHPVTASENTGGRAPTWP